MMFIDNIDYNDIKLFLNFKDELKGKVKVGAAMNDPLAFMIWNNQGPFILKVVNDHEILINGTKSEEYSFYWEMFMLRLYQDSYLEYKQKRLKEIIINNTITLTPFGIPEGFDISQAVDQASEEIFKLIYPNFKKYYDDMEKEALTIWPNVPCKEKPYIKQRGKDENIKPS